MSGGFNPSFSSEVIDSLARSRPHAVIVHDDEAAGADLVVEGVERQAYRVVPVAVRVEDRYLRDRVGVGRQGVVEPPLDHAQLSWIREAPKSLGDVLLATPA